MVAWRNVSPTPTGAGSWVHVCDVHEFERPHWEVGCAREQPSHGHCHGPDTGKHLRHTFISHGTDCNFFRASIVHVHACRSSLAKSVGHFLSVCMRACHLTCLVHSPPPGSPGSVQAGMLRTSLLDCIPARQPRQPSRRQLIQVGVRYSPCRSQLPPSFCLIGLIVAPLVLLY